MNLQTTFIENNLAACGRIVRLEGANAVPDANGRWRIHVVDMPVDGMCRVTLVRMSGTERRQPNDARFVSCL